MKKFDTVFVFCPSDLKNNLIFSLNDLRTEQNKKKTKIDLEQKLTVVSSLARASSSTSTVDNDNHNNQYESKHRIHFGVRF